MTAKTHTLSLQRPHQSKRRNSTPAGLGLIAQYKTTDSKTLTSDSIITMIEHESERHQCKTRYHRYLRDKTTKDSQQDGIVIKQRTTVNYLEASESSNFFIPLGTDSG